MTTSFIEAATKSIDVDGDRFVYRELGPAAGIPVIFLHHFTGVLDDWDPQVVEGIAERRRVIIFDNRGVGASGGATPDTVQEMAQDAVRFIRRLGHEKVDLLGFSLGGFIAQVIMTTEPGLVRKVILAGTGPAGAEGLDGIGAVVQEARARSAETGKHHKHFLFFSPTADSQSAAASFMERISARQENRDPAASDQTIKAQFDAIRGWGLERSRSTEPPIHPVLIVNGDDDLMVPTANSFELLKQLPNANLSILPDSGHGAIFQYHETFVQQAQRFLSRESGGLASL